MSITISGLKFNDPQAIREFTHNVLREASHINNDDPEATYDFEIVNFGKLRFHSMHVYNIELSRVSGWDFVAMAGLTAIYAKRKDGATK